MTLEKLLKIGNWYKKRTTNKINHCGLFACFEKKMYLAKTVKEFLLYCQFYKMDCSWSFTHSITNEKLDVTLCPQRKFGHQKAALTHVCWHDERITNMALFWRKCQLRKCAFGLERFVSTSKLWWIFVNICRVRPGLRGPKVVLPRIFGKCELRRQEKRGWRLCLCFSSLGHLSRYVHSKGFWIVVNQPAILQSNVTKLPILSVYGTGNKNLFKCDPWTASVQNLHFKNFINFILLSVP